MKKWIMVLGCYGLMVGAAQAAARWPEGPCQDVRQAVARHEKIHAEFFASVPKMESAADLAGTRQELLLLLRDHCAANVQPLLDRDQAAVNALRDTAVAKHTNRGPAADPPRPVFCDTTPKAYGGSTTDCF